MKPLSFKKGLSKDINKLRNEVRPTVQRRLNQAQLVIPEGIVRQNRTMFEGSSSQQPLINQPNPSRLRKPNPIELELGQKLIVDDPGPLNAQDNTAFVPYSPLTSIPAAISRRIEIIQRYQAKNAWFYSGCIYDTNLLNEPSKYLALGLLTEKELANLRPYVNIRRFRTFKECSG
jgi:hypothetical protein